MFSNMRRYLIISVMYRKCLTRSIHDGVFVNARYSNNAAYKRFYCHTTIDEQNTTSTDLRNHRAELDKQKLEKILSEPENYKRFQILELEVDVCRHNAERVPNNIKPKDWLVLLHIRMKAKRKKYLDFLWRNERSAENQKAKKELKRAEWLAKVKDPTEDTGEMKYGLLDNTLFMRIYESTMSRYFNGKMILSMMFEPKIVFDCGYENDMTRREIHNCAKQMSLAFASNRIHVNPMFFYYCNFNKDGLLKQHLHQNIPSLMQDDFPVIMTSQSYLDIFPKNQLVYLTPHCRENLNEYDPEAVYIIGALVDKSDTQPLSLAKAKKEGIRMARFPIDKYLSWGASSSKSLTLDQTIKIMLDLRQTGDWNKALANAPIRKLKPFRENALKRQLQRAAFSNTSETQECKVQDFTFESRKMN